MSAILLLYLARTKIILANQSWKGQTRSTTDEKEIQWWLGWLCLHPTLHSLTFLSSLWSFFFLSSQYVSIVVRSTFVIIIFNYRQKHELSTSSFVTSTQNKYTITFQSELVLYWCSEEEDPKRNETKRNDTKELLTIPPWPLQLKKESAVAWIYLSIRILRLQKTWAIQSLLWSSFYIPGREYEIFPSFIRCPPWWNIASSICIKFHVPKPTCEKNSNADKQSYCRQ